MKPGIYRTEYGNAAVICGDKAYDLDMGEEIPIEAVTSEFIRPADDCDLAKLG